MGCALVSIPGISQSTSVYSSLGCREYKGRWGTFSSWEVQIQHVGCKQKAPLQPL